MMAAKKPSLKRSRESRSPRLVSLETNSPKKFDSHLDIALAAIVSSKKQKEVSDFINFLLTSLERNSEWLNNIVSKQNEFKCALMIGAGPNRFQFHELIYPSEDKHVRLEVELRESEDHDKIAIAALLKLSTIEMNQLMDYIKNHLFENASLREDLLKGKALGINFAVLRPFADKQYRVMERIVIGSYTKCVVPAKKRREDKSLVKPHVAKKAKIVA